MKLRFQGNTLRLRLSQSDVARLSEAGRVEEHVSFAAGQSLDYAIESRATEPAETDEIRASFDGGRILVSLPGAAARRWVESSETGIEAVSGPVRVLIEKDFQCLHRDAEQDGDAFPNPLAQS